MTTTTLQNKANAEGSKVETVPRKHIGVERKNQLPIFQGFARTVLMAFHNRLDTRLLDQLAQPHQHGDAKYRGCADPSRLQGSTYVSQARLRRAVRAVAVAPIITLQRLCVKG